MSRHCTKLCKFHTSPHLVSAVVIKHARAENGYGSVLTLFIICIPAWCSLPVTPYSEYPFHICHCNKGFPSYQGRVGDMRLHSIKRSPAAPGRGTGSLLTTVTVPASESRPSLRPRLPAPPPVPPPTLRGAPQSSSARRNPADPPLHHLPLQTPRPVSAGGGRGGRRRQ